MKNILPFYNRLIFILKFLCIFHFDIGIKRVRQYYMHFLLFVGASFSIHDIKFKVSSLY